MVDVGRKVFQTANDQVQFCVHGRLICQLLALLLQTVGLTRRFGGLTAVGQEVDLERTHDSCALSRR